MVIGIWFMMKKRIRSHNKHYIDLRVWSKKEPSRAKSWICKKVNITVNQLPVRIRRTYSWAKLLNTSREFPLRAREVRIELLFCWIRRIERGSSRQSSIRWRDWGRARFVGDQLNEKWCVEILLPRWMSITRSPTVVLANLHGVIHIRGHRCARPPTIKF